MSKKDEALKLALETAEGIAGANWREWHELASPEEFERWVKSRATHMAVAIREALAEQPAQQQKPVAIFDEQLGRPKMLSNAPMLTNGQELYTSPPASKPWVGLTKEDRYKAIRPLYNSDENARLAVEHSNDEYEALEDRLREKNA